jgi:uncharacterized repeat protein (TIGR03803 family)
VFLLARSAHSGLRALTAIFSLMLLGALSGCHWDLFGSDSSDSAPAAPAATYTVGGTVSGLASGASFTLLDNGADSLSVIANGAFTFATALPAASAYAVTTGSEPLGQTCTVAGGAGTISEANVTSVAVSCTDQTFALGGTIQGLNGSGLVLANGSATLTVPAGAQSFTLPTMVAYGSSYSVTIQAQPAGFSCLVNAGGGTMPANAVTSIAIICTAQLFTVGGSISGLGAKPGLVLANGTDTLNVPANASGFTMPTRVASGTPYNVTVAKQPFASSCSVSNGSGIVAAAIVSNITITCSIGTESVLYSFAGAPVDGAQPSFGGRLLLASDGNFYGVTSLGGTNNDGTVFRITPAGLETVLWSFGNGNDGVTPYGGLIQGRDGNFYGMTNVGGAHGDGTVYKITPAGLETVLWSFGETNDGSYSYGSLIQGVDGNFYGMGYGGGVYGGGIVFKITPAGLETVLWSFGNGSDGSLPYGNLILGSDGNFYGMTYMGGVNGKGIIFKVTPAGAETVLWSFGASGDGAYPGNSLTLGTDGNFYGTTTGGGANQLGTIFRFTPGGVETVLHSFGAGDGYQPDGNLIQGPDGNFYGMTELGGLEGWGMIFEMTPGGAETMLYSFTIGSTDALNPRGDLTLGADGTLYGLAQGGGANNLGAVFTFK